MEHHNSLTHILLLIRLLSVFCMTYVRTRCMCNIEKQSEICHTPENTILFIRNT